ncbi:unnamed protein product [Lampetra fluviatilis]
MGYGRELFLMDLSLVDCNGLPAYYQNLSEAWRSLEWARKSPYCGMAAFLTEPLFFNDLFGGVKGEKAMAFRFIRAGVKTVGDITQSRDGCQSSGRMWQSDT